MKQHCCLLSVFLTQNVGNGPEAVAGEALQEPEHEEGDVVGGEGGEQPGHQAHRIAVIELQTTVREDSPNNEKDPTWAFSWLTAPTYHI